MGQYWDILKGHTNEMLGLNINVSAERLKICRKCPVYSPKFGGLCNSRLWFNPETGDVSTEEKDNYIRGCGCRLKAKTTLMDATCVANKW